VTSPATTRPTNRANTSARRQEVLDTATTVFADKGIIATTVPRHQLVARILRQDEHHIRDLAGLDEVVRQRRAIRARVETVITTGITTGEFRTDCDPLVASMAYFDKVLGAYRHRKPIGNRTTAGSHTNSPIYPPGTPFVVTRDYAKSTALTYSAYICR
jgi:Tetracyclin repressor-like, C-terminal domain